MFVTVEKIQDTIRAFAPTSEAQRWLKDRALDVSGDIAEARWFLLDDLDSAMPVPFLMILVFWLALIFFCYGLFSPANFTVLTVMFLLRHFPSRLRSTSCWRWTIRWTDRSRSRRSR